GQRPAGAKRTMVDIFCGAGGTSCGARMAGFEPVIAVDNWEPACKTYRENFPQAAVFEQDVTSFIHHKLRHKTHVDVLHISPPCQPYSPAHTRAGRNDERNIAALFSSEVIDKLRPRLATLEQTYGITHEAHVGFFHALLQSYTRRNFSVRWKIVRFLEYGLPQIRRRLVMICSCPGEKLPTFPPATHGNVTGRARAHAMAARGQGLKPYMTEAQAIGNIPRRATLHDVDGAFPVNVPAHDPNLPLARTITCGGAEKKYHYSGKRAYTVRELACLQGFPITYQFLGTAQTVIRKQVGNAFPPSVVKVIYEHLRAWLDELDR
ncbi:S-adenosyl-L-methionine-dependent methyltransferase, partial [Coniella lustricola]